MKRLLSISFTLALLLLSLPASAQQKQKFSVSSFEYNPFDMAAQSAKLDGSGNRYAIIKVSSTNPDDDLKEYTFNFGNLRSFVEEHDNELWVYVQKNAKTVTISRQGYTTINRYDLKTTIESGKTYVMMLSTAVTVINKQMLQFVVKPANSKAIVTVKNSKQNSKDEVLGVVDKNGTIATSLEYGIYTYSVIAPGYQISEGRITLHDKSKTFVEDVELYEGSAYETKTDKVSEVKFNISPQVENAVVLLKKKKAGSQEEILGVMDTSGVMTKSIDNDIYTYRVVANDYHIASGELALTGKTKETTVNVEMKPNFSNVTLFVDMDADIYLNGDNKGQRSWTGVLRAGKYQVECKKDKHRNSIQVITVGDDDDRTFKLANPEPIVGSFAITSSPLGATVMVDGKELGNTPLTINDMLVGNYDLALTHEGYMTKVQKLEIKEGEVSEVNAELYSGGKFTFKSDPDGAELFINDKSVGKTPYSEEFLAGEYNVKLVNAKYLDLVKKIQLDPKSPIVNLKMKQDRFKKNSFYWQFSGQAGSATGAGVNMGFYFKNVNIETFATYLFDTVDLYAYSVNYHEGGSVLAGIVGGKIGYGIKLNRMIRLTPQVGYGHVVLSDMVSTYADYVSVGVRAELMLARWFGVSLTPEASFEVKKGDTYKEIADLSSKVKGWSNGFNVRLGLFFNL